MYVARDFVDGLSVGDFYVTDSYSLGMIGTFRDADGKTEKWYDGYVFVFYRFIDEVEVEGNSYLSCMDHMYSHNAASWVQDFGYGFEQITVCVNDKGVIYASYRHPLQIEEVMAEDVPLLSYEQIIGTLEYEVPMVHGRYICFNNLELKYFRVKDDTTDGSYAIVPAWQLTKEKNESISYYTVINAIDGSIIYVVEEIYDIEYDTEDSGVVIN